MLSSLTATVALSVPKPVDVLVIGGGPAGLASATSLAKLGLGVTLLESRASAAAFESSRAYLYLVDTRGQKWTDAMGLTPALRERGVSNDGYQITRAFPNKKGAVTTTPILAQEATAKAVWIPRASLLELMAKGAAEAGVELRYDSALAELSPAADDGSRATATTARGEQFAPRLLLGCDGLDSRVRAALQEWSGDDAYEPVCLPSPSAGLQYRMLLVPPSFALANLTSADAPPVWTAPESAYSVPGKLGGLRLGLLPSKDPSVPRTANVIKPPSHPIWKLKTAAELRSYLGDAFPQIADLDAFLSDEEAENFVDGARPPGRFPPPQFVRRVTGASGGTGVALLGDAIHAFPPDLGQGVNSALDDVGALVSAMEGEGAVGGDADAKLPAALDRFQRERAPAAEALARIQVCGFPFQYGQGPAWRRALFLLGFACRLGLSKLSAAIFAPPVAFQVLNGDDYVAVWRRAQKTTRLLQLTALALVAAALGRSALRELFCVWLLFPG